ncbi:MAG: aminodeoxychorismate/anthranilate synthase component II [Planctomycetes bacterium]|nr:aminodeoxychorismate/anthranilate synthase component II [Planctomycetota bacterium]
MLLLLDNYDSFTFNLAQYFMELGQDVRVVRNDELSVEQALALKPERVCISPGPGRPAGAGITLALIAACAGKLPVVGVCLGHQAIAEHFGGRVVHAPSLMHGKTSAVYHEGAGLFRGLPSPFTACRYHSLTVDPDTLPACIEVTARTQEGPSTGSGQGVIMGLRHRELEIEGVQFHPEAILTQHGHAMLRNWLNA